MVQHNDANECGLYWAKEVYRKVRGEVNLSGRRVAVSLSCFSGDANPSV
jgi:hypothetical protein